MQKRASSAFAAKRFMQRGHIGLTGTASRLGAAERLHAMDMNAGTGLFVKAIDPARLDVIYSSGSDGYGNRLHPFAATATPSRVSKSP
jgi:hypothetical protein